MIQDKNGVEIVIGSVLVGDHFGETFVVSHLESRVIRGVYRFGLREYEDARIDALHLLARPDNCWTVLGNISVVEDFLRALTRHAKGRIAVEPKTDSVFRDSDFEHGVRVDDPAHSTDSVFRAVIHEALRKIGARQMGAKK